jgi:hypothetical protein
VRTLLHSQTKNFTQTVELQARSFTDMVEYQAKSFFLLFVTCAFLWAVCMIIWTFAIIGVWQEWQTKQFECLPGKSRLNVGLISRLIQSKILVAPMKQYIDSDTDMLQCLIRRLQGKNENLFKFETSTWPSLGDRCFRLSLKEWFVKLTECIPGFEGLCQQHTLAAPHLPDEDLDNNKRRKESDSIGR